MSNSRVALLVTLALIVGMLIPTFNNQVVTSQAVVQPNRVMERNAAILAGTVRPRPKEQLISGSHMLAYLDALNIRRAGALGAAKNPPAATAGATRRTMGCSNTFVGSIPNVRVNQDCSLRRQAEESIAIDPLDRSHLVAGQNDSRIGFNHCGLDFSFNRGEQWGDLLPTYYDTVLLDGHTADACSDPTSAFDSRGNAYFGSVLFDITSAASAIVVIKANADTGGTFYHTPNSALSFQEFRTSPVGLPSSDNDPNIANDKELMTADSNPASPKRDNVYVTWTLFNFNTGAGVGAHSAIFFSQSTDGGASWSPRIEINGANAAICTVFSGEANPNACDQDQGSMPFVGPDGTLYVVFGNGNTPTVGVNQVLLVKCPAASDCSLPASWTAPVRVSDLYTTQPFGPDAATGCSAGRQCLPPNGYRLDGFVEISGGVSRTTGRIFVSWGDSRNLAANCNPNGDAATAVPPCDMDVMMAFSDNGGTTWSAPVNVSKMAGNDHNAGQLMPWTAVAPDGRLYIAYYDRKYGSCETTGCLDITLAVSGNNGVSFSYSRITTASMPNLVVANNPIQAGFLGDYMQVAADTDGAVVVWADTRPRPGFTFPEEDIYAARVRGRR